MGSKMAEETLTMSSREVVSLVSNELTVTFVENFVKTNSLSMFILKPFPQRFKKMVFMLVWMKKWPKKNN